jgi:glycosyltransferase involved in cell wall biosynthesis
MSPQFFSRKILIVATSDSGGAGEFMLKFAYYLQELGHTVCFLVKEKTKRDSFIVRYVEKRNYFQRLENKIYNVLMNFFFQNLSFNEKYCFYSVNEKGKNVNINSLISKLEFTPEFIFSGWTSDFLNSTDLLNFKNHFGAKIYVVSMDMNHLTGGCHYAWDCNGYINGCNTDCPAIKSHKSKKLAKKNFIIKHLNAQKGGFNIISGSGWTLKQAQKSLIYKNQIEFPNINSLIDTRVMNPKSRSYAKDIFELNNDNFYILCGSQNSNDPRKGFDFLLESFILLYNILSEKDRKKVNIIIVSQTINKKFDTIPFEKKQLKFIADYRLLSLLYQAVDLYVNSSIEDSGPMMVSEAMACGTPVVGFDMGVVNNLVITGYNGYKAKLKNSEDLADGIKKILNLDKDEYKIYSDNAVETVIKYSSFQSCKEVINKILMD